MQKPVKHILGLEEPPCQAVAKELVRRGGESPDAPSLVVVPTREAARLLKEQLALTAAGETGRGAFVSPRIIQVSQLVGHAEGKVAAAGVSLCVWQAVLRRAEPWIARLFPKTETWGDEAWLHAAEGMQQLFHTLAQEGVEIGGEAWQRLSRDDARWEVLLALRQRYLGKLSDMGLQDADSAPTLLVNAGTRVILACVPGLPQQVEHLLATARLPVEVWIPCEEPYAAWFDAWGRPGREWLNTTDRDELGLAREGWKQRLIVAGDAWALAAQTARATARANAVGGGVLHAVGVGVCDPGLEPAIAEEFAMHGVTTYRPEGTPFSATTWQRTLDALAELAKRIDPTPEGGAVDPEALAVAPLAELLRQPVIAVGLDIPAAVAALRQLKELRARFLPDRVGFLLQKTADCPELKQATDILLPWLQQALSSGRALLQALAALAEAQPAGNDAMLKLAEGVRDACEDLLGMGAARLSTAGALLLLGKQLAALSIQSKREGAQLSLNGWMELLYSPAERLVIAGMHDKQIPERWPVSPLLTRSARQCLGIRGDDDRAARDAFILRCLLGSRKPGAVSFIFSLTDIGKDPAAPSPLLFTLCPKNRLPEVVAHFFGKDHTRPGSPSPAFSIEGWHYLPLGVPDHELTPQEAARLHLSDCGLPNPMQGREFSPSMLADFLRCPLRFWIKRVRRLKDDDADDERETLQQRHVGDCLHRVLELFVRQHPSWESYSAAHPGLHLVSDETVEQVRNDLLQLFATTYNGEYGTSPLLPQQMQRDNMAARLAAYAAEHVQLWREGWSTAQDAQGDVLVEYQANWTWQNHRLSMKIDRVDERTNQDGTRELRIIDYKTGNVEGCGKKHLARLSPKAMNPAELSPLWEPPLAYVRGKAETHRWVELQLPLYVHWAMRQLPVADRYQAAYICLDRTPSDTRLLVWGESGERGLFDTADGESLIDNAAHWAKACMDMIAAGQCLVSAEQLGWGHPAYDLFDEATEHVELRDLFLPSTTQRP